MLRISCPEAIMQVSRWGNSLAVRLPKSVVDALNLKEGDDVALEVLGERSLAVARTPDNRELLARLRRFRGRLPADFRFDRLEAHARGPDEGSEVGVNEADRRA
jgi:antitoxin MazE